jgi:hypothetical protein
MPWGRGRLFEKEFASPVQQVIPCGLSGEGLNPFTAPSKWTTRLFNPVAAGYSVILAAIANKAIRLYKYSILMIPPVGATVTCVPGWGGGAGSIMAHQCPIIGAAFINATFNQMDFGPVGIAWGIGLNFDMFISAASSIWFTFQYSLEPYGSANDGD